MSQPPLGQSGGQQQQNLDLAFYGGGSDIRIQGMFHQSEPHNALQAVYPTPSLPSNESVEVGLTANGYVHLTPTGPLSSASAVPDASVFSGVVPLATRTGAREESNLIDSMFAPSTGDTGNGLLDGLKGLAVCEDAWKGSSGLPEWKHDSKSRPPIGSRFQWGS